jgi:hypothetical protein
MRRQQGKAGKFPGSGQRRAAPSHSWMVKKLHNNNSNIELMRDFLKQDTFQHYGNAI